MICWIALRRFAVASCSTSPPPRCSSNATSDWIWHMTKSIGVGVIGMGWMGVVHSRSYRLIADRFPESGVRARLVICADEVEARAREARERVDFEQYTTDWRQVIAHPDVQVVNVTSPNHLHRE